MPVLLAVVFYSYMESIWFDATLWFNMDTGEDQIDFRFGLRRETVLLPHGWDKCTVNSLPVFNNVVYFIPEINKVEVQMYNPSGKLVASTRLSWYGHKDFCPGTWDGKNGEVEGRKSVTPEGESFVFVTLGNVPAGGFSYQGNNLFPQVLKKDTNAIDLLQGEFYIVYIPQQEKVVVFLDQGAEVRPRMIGVGKVK